MRIIIAGSRDFNDYKICSECYEELDNNLYCKYCDINYNKYIK